MWDDRAGDAAGAGEAAEPGHGTGVRKKKTARRSRRAVLAKAISGGAYLLC